MGDNHKINIHFICIYIIKLSFSWNKKKKQKMNKISYNIIHTFYSPKYDMKALIDIPTDKDVDINRMHSQTVMCH